MSALAPTSRVVVIPALSSSIAFAADSNTR
jgi:hypothetical protein